jgi:hypothetical protein
LQGALKHRIARKPSTGNATDRARCCGQHICGVGPFRLHKFSQVLCSKNYNGLDEKLQACIIARVSHT